MFFTNNLEFVSRVSYSQICTSTRLLVFRRSLNVNLVSQIPKWRLRFRDCAKINFVKFLGCKLIGPVVFEKLLLDLHKIQHGC